MNVYEVDRLLLPTVPRMNDQIHAGDKQIPSDNGQYIIRKVIGKIEQILHWAIVCRGECDCAGYGMHCPLKFGIPQCWK
jgi:hypothetical protein